ncbi:MAG: hypothetical protein GTN84_11220 [Hydrogenophaga sp.]|uniref:DUF6891 domain-containing protein n=1 Tax=Hydrogenophaga sp. TaxID=1904254 RepID=UPI0016B213C5|nr:hypothetical protein [Hydrogenophaga sp.]NIM41655.1 hypothetical protein [Hydrogenophaga sp.]NIN26960.1 hypothetical protein [Hydrogenophaga sp.]NIN31661.1 hypothetical protein [Hydrogenophaga sp.]NIN55905.1 hypothetical protein [Hydrogenophaga sp.]NIO52032.1 hypothetical protein [Hydrogenophaga sp.]
MTDTTPASFLSDVELSFPPAERLGAKVEYFHFLPHEKSYTVNVYFIRQAPDAATIDRVMRECLALAAAHDGRFMISGGVYLASGDDIDVHERTELLPWGKDRFLCFDPTLRQIGVRRYGKKHFEDKQAITEVGTIGTGDKVDYPGRPVNPVYEGEDMDEEVDDATDTQRAMVSEWLWYGYCSPESIHRWIDENHAAGDGFDLAWIKAFAGRALARKRAAEAGWPQVTDVDRLDQAFTSLHDQGICAVQWAGNTMAEGEQAVWDAIDDACEAGVAEDHYWGVCFFHSQDMDSALQGEGLRIAFSGVETDDEAQTLRVAQLICQTLQQHGLRTDWNGRADTRIALPALCWQSRTRQD